MDYFLIRFERIYENFCFSLRIYVGNPDRQSDSYHQCLKEIDRICDQHDYQDNFSRRLKSVAEDFRYKLKWAYNKSKALQS